MANRIFGVHMILLLEVLFVFAFDISFPPIKVNEYPENIKAIGSTGRTNLLY